MDERFHSSKGSWIFENDIVSKFAIKFVIFFDSLSNIPLLIKTLKQSYRSNIDLGRFFNAYIKYKSYRLFKDLLISSS